MIEKESDEPTIDWGAEADKPLECPLKTEGPCEACD